MFDILLRTGDGSEVIDSANDREDALILAMTYAEVHYDTQFGSDRGRLGLGAMTGGRDECIGYRFLNRAGTLITYRIWEV